MTFNYQFALGQGLNPYLLKSLDQVFGYENTPQYKIDNIGFISLLKSQKADIKLNRPNGNGAIDFLQVKYRQRAVVGQTGTSDTCATANISPYQEAAVPLNIFRQYSLFIDDALIQEYTSDANQIQTVGMPPSMATKEMIDQIMAATNAIMVGLDTDLQNAVVYGNNVRVNTNAAQNLNITLNTTNLPLQDGLTQLLADAITNQFAAGKPQIYGSGLFLNFMMQQNAKGLAQNGLDTAIEAMGVKFFYDQYAQNILGSNQIGVFSPDAIAMVEFDRFTGKNAGQKGISYFGNIPLPMQLTGDRIIPVTFDYQLRYLDCPEAVAQVNDYYGNPVVGERGWQMIISKKVGLFQPPTNAYKASDSLVNTNGAIRYTITNI